MFSGSLWVTSQLIWLVTSKEVQMCRLKERLCSTFTFFFLKTKTFKHSRRRLIQRSADYVNCFEHLQS